MKKIWKLEPQNNDLQNEIINSLSTSTIIKPLKPIVQILKRLNLLTKTDIELFFCEDEYSLIESLHDPYLLLNMEKSVQRILCAINLQQKILIIGDYDVDGTCATSVLYLFLKKLNALVEFYIPNRFNEGYGVSDKAIDFAIDNEFNLIITVDCGIKSTSKIARANSNNIETIISDHHLPDNELPPAFAILNPKQPHCKYPCKDLCGCGIVFKLVTAISIKKGFNNNEYLEYIDLVALATAADIVPMINENRTLVKLGLNKINHQPQPGLNALKDKIKTNNILKVRDLVFALAPRINAAGRMEDAKYAVELFTSVDFDKIKQIADDICNLNIDRQVIDKETHIQAVSQVYRKIEKNRKSIVVYNPNWNKGVIGIVASRLLEEFYKPTIVLTDSNGTVSGSARSIEGVNIYEAIAECHEYLNTYGGHFAAAGLTLNKSKIEDFKAAFEQAIRKQLKPELELPSLQVSAVLDFEEINFDLYNELIKLEPYGPANLEPIFESKNVSDTGKSKIVKDKHIYFTLKQQEKTISGIGFGLADKFAILKNKKSFDIVYKISKEIYNKKEYLKLLVIDLK